MLRRAVILHVLLLSFFYPNIVSAEDASVPGASAAVSTGTVSAEQPVPEIKATQPVEYTVNQNDILQINVYQEEDLTILTRVSARGYISYPLLGQVKVSGLTVAEVEEKLTRLLKKDYLVNPQVTIFIKEFNTKKVTMMGAIKNPGSYEIPPGNPLTLMQAISIAGGFTSVANRTKVRIIRWDENQEKTIEVNTRDITGKGDRGKDVMLQSDDIVYVPESFF